MVQRPELEVQMERRLNRLSKRRWFGFIRQQRLVYPSRELNRLLFGCLAALVLSSCSGERASESQAQKEIGDRSFAFLMIVNGLGAQSQVEASLFQTAEISMVEGRVVDCVSDAGFSYVPLPVGAWYPTPDGAGSLEYAKRAGYGISTSTGPPPLPDNPNESYREGLTADGRQRFDASVSECAAVASVEVQQLAAPSPELLLELDELSEEISADPRTVATTADFRVCMSEQGFVNVSSPREALQSFVERFRSETSNPDRSRV